MKLANHLEESRCPHCEVARPALPKIGDYETNDHSGTMPRKWRIYKCNSCGGLIVAWALKFDGEVVESFPASQSVNNDIPERPAAYLQQAIESLHAPAGAVMLAASSVDSMLKIKGFSSGSLYERIEAAADQHLITSEMAKWAHEVRLDANDQRHADEARDLPNVSDAKRVVEFVQAFAQFLFVLPARIERGISKPDEAGS